MSFPEYKRKARESTEARVREKDATAARRRNAELDQDMDDRIARENSAALEKAVDGLVKAQNERDTYRQAALELQAEIRSALSWIDTGAEPAVAHSMLRKSADKWLPVLEALEPPS